MNLPFNFTYSSILYLFLAIAFNLLYHFILGARLAFLIRTIGGKISIMHSFYVFCITKFSSIITPFITGSLISKPLATRHYTGLPISKGLLVTVFEQLIDLVLLIFLFPITIIFAGSYFLSFTTDIYIIITFITSILALTCLIIFIFKYEYFIKLCWNIKNFFPKFLLNFGRKHKITKKDTIMKFSQIKEQFLNRKTILRILPYTMLQALLIPLVLYFTIATIHFKINYPTAFLLYFIPTIIGRLSGVPGGFGTTDITLGSLLLFLGMTPINATFVILLFRIISLSPAIIIGGYLTFYLSTKYSLKLLASSEKNHNPKN